jgi:hypothetical protein
MTEDEDQEIVAALAKLAEQDAAAADDARAALEWIAGEQDLAFITQARIQNFCWYDLPVKWFVDLDEKVRVTAALAQALDLLQLQLRHLAQDLGLARRSGRTLTLTAKGRRLRADPGGLWRAGVAGLLGDDDFPAFAGELFLALLLDAQEVPGRQINAAVGLAAAEEGFRDSRTGEPPDERGISWAVHATSNLCRALGLLAVGAGWTDRSYGLTGTGQATALEALRARATGPRTIPWP